MTFVVSVIGLKKSGKTTVVEHLVRELNERGHRVGTLKSMVHSVFSIDVEGKDTFRHREAGAAFVISLSKTETAFIERHEEGKGRRRLADVLPLVPEGTDLLVCEGLEDDDPSIAQVVCMKDPGLWDETCKVRPVGKPVAISGIVANELSEFRDLRVYNVLNGNDRNDFVEMLERMMLENLMTDARESLVNDARDGLGKTPKESLKPSGRNGLGEDESEGTGKNTGEA